MMEKPGGAWMQLSRTWHTPPNCAPGRGPCRRHCAARAGAHSLRRGADALEKGVRPTGRRPEICDEARAGGHRVLAPLRLQAAGSTLRRCRAPAGPRRNTPPPRRGSTPSGLARAWPPPARATCSRLRGSSSSAESRSATAHTPLRAERRRSARLLHVSCSLLSALAEVSRQCQPFAPQFFDVGCWQVWPWHLFLLAASWAEARGCTGLYWVWRRAKSSSTTV